MLRGAGSVASGFHTPRAGGIGDGVYDLLGGTVYRRIQAIEKLLSRLWKAAGLR